MVDQPKGPEEDQAADLENLSPSATSPEDPTKPVSERVTVVIGSTKEAPVPTEQVPTVTSNTIDTIPGKTDDLSSQGIGDKVIAAFKTSDSALLGEKSPKNLVELPAATLRSIKNTVAAAGVVGIATFSVSAAIGISTGVAAAPLVATGLSVATLAAGAVFVYRGVYMLGGAIAHTGRILSEKKQKSKA